MRVVAGTLEDIPADRCTAIADGRAIVVRVGDEVVAFENRCLHLGSPLAGVVVRDGVLTCPMHFWRYRLPAGANLGSEGGWLPAYQVSIEDGEVVVEIPVPEPARSMRELLLEHARTWNRGDP
jgi:nitrite reductase/ring-hydroxylating ferredoxin subunit